MEIQKNGNFEKQKFGKIEIWKMEIWKFGKMQILKM